MDPARRRVSVTCAAISHLVPEDTNYLKRTFERQRLT